MTNLTKLATLAATTFVLTTTFATAMSIPTTAPGPIPTPNDPPTVTTHGAPDLGCRMKGFDFWIINFGSANDGTGYELVAIASVVIGGTSLFGGSGSLIGTVAGAIMLGALANILQLNNINAALQLLATGAIIVLAAVLQSLVRRREGFGR